jgi:fumarate reductase subunit C
MAKPYPRQHQPVNWFMRHPHYMVFMLRELSAIFLAIYLVVLLLLVGRVHDSETAFEDFRDLLASPLMIVFHTIVLLFAILHSVTWFQAVPKAMRVRLGDELLPPMKMIAPVILAWIGISVVILAIFLI